MVQYTQGEATYVSEYSFPDRIVGKKRNAKEQEPEPLIATTVRPSGAPRSKGHFLSWPFSSVVMSFFFRLFTIRRISRLYALRLHMITCEDGIATFKPLGTARAWAY